MLCIQYALLLRLMGYRPRAIFFQWGRESFYLLKIVQKSAALNVQISHFNVAVLCKFIILFHIDDTALFCISWGNAYTIDDIMY